MRHLLFYKKRGCLAHILFLALLTAGCATGPGRIYPKSPSLPENTLLTAVPFFPQKRYQCGPAALAMVLGWAGIDIRPDQLVTAVYTPGRKGSLQTGLITAARRHGKLAYPVHTPACLFRETAAGRPVIVLQNLGLSWFPRWHYAVVIGYDMDQGVVVLHTGRTAFRRVGFKTFEKTWSRSDYWGLVVLPTDQMPDCADETAYLKAALGLQLAGHTTAATEAFGRAVARWPQSTQANIALGNAFYSQGAPQKAIQSYHRALQIDPQNGVALNNLAHLLAASGELEKAQEMAIRAVNAGGPNLQTSKQTLEEIRLKRQRK